MVRGSKGMKRWLLMATPLLFIFAAVIGALGWDINDSSQSMEQGLAGMSIERVGNPLELASLPAIKKGPFNLKKNSTLKYVTNKAGKRDLRVSLIVISDKKNIAVVNGRFLTEGDDIMGLKVKRIEKERILLAGREEFWENLESR